MEKTKKPAGCEDKDEIHTEKDKTVLKEEDGDEEQPEDKQRWGKKQCNCQRLTDSASSRRKVASLTSRLMKRRNRGASASSM